MTDSVNCSALADSMRRAMCDMLVSAVDMRKRISDHEPDIRQRGESSERRSGTKGRFERAEARMSVGMQGLGFRYMRQGNLIIVVVVKRRSDTRVIADALGVVGRVESVVGDAVDVVAERSDLAEGPDNLLVRAHLNDAMVVLIADQGVAVLQTQSASRERTSACAIDAPRIALGIGVGEVLPEYSAVLIGFHNAGVAGVGDQSMPVRKAAGKSHRAEEHSPGGSVGVDDRAWGRVCDLERLVVVFVADENVAVLKELGAVGIIEAIVFPDNLLVEDADFDNAAVALVGDEHVPVGEPGILHGGIELIRAVARDAKLAVLPDDVPEGIYQEDTVVRATIRVEIDAVG